MAAFCGRLVSSMFLLLGTMVAMGEACTCMPSHPQAAFCRAQFAIKAKITSEASVWEQDFGYGYIIRHAHYAIEIEEYFKGGEIVSKLENKTFIHTFDNDAHCGTKLDYGSEYLLTGTIRNNDHLHIKTCHLKEKWQCLSAQMEKGITGGYNCKCTPATCTAPNSCMTRQKHYCKMMVNGGTPAQEDVMRHCVCKTRDDNTCEWASKENYLCEKGEEVVDRQPGGEGGKKDQECPGRTDEELQRMKSVRKEEGKDNKPIKAGTETKKDEDKNKDKSKSVKGKEKDGDNNKGKSGADGKSKSGKGKEKDEDKKKGKSAAGKGTKGDEDKDNGKSKFVKDKETDEDKKKDESKSKKDKGKESMKSGEGKSEKKMRYNRHQATKSPKNKSAANDGEETERIGKEP